MALVLLSQPFDSPDRKIRPFTNTLRFQITAKACGRFSFFLIGVQSLRPRVSTPSVIVSYTAGMP